MWGEETARCAFTRTRPSSLPSATSSCGLPRPVRPGASGCGSARRAQIPAATAPGQRHPLGRGELHRHPPCAHQPRLCWRLRLWQNPPGNDPGCRWHAQKAPETFAALRVASAHPEHHPGFIDWQSYEANQKRIAQNTRPGPHKAGGAVREGGALLQGSPTAATAVAACIPTTAAATPRPAIIAGQGPGRGPRRLLPEYRRRPDR